MKKIFIKHNIGFISTIIIWALMAIILKNVYILFLILGALIGFMFGITSNYKISWNDTNY